MWKFSFFSCPAEQAVSVKVEQLRVVENSSHNLSEFSEQVNSVAALSLSFWPIPITYNILMFAQTGESAAGEEVIFEQ